MSKLDEIWKGDKLKRRDEARLLERFLGSEAKALHDMGREQSFVLALDAQYGEGKTWFLDRLRQQLEINHPVAFIDAWVDDANNEPLVSIMVALEEALAPFLKRPAVSKQLGAVTRAALPILGKGALGAGGKLITKYFGDDIGNETREAISSATQQSSAAEKTEKNDVFDAGVSKIVDGVSQVVDSAGKAMLDQYKKRQKSRTFFKENLRKLAASIETTRTDPRHAPVYVIIDELDRCRPSYAISVLEEIKHLFDVPGIIFVIALYGDQLEHSIKAVYGQDFDAKSYLRRFFSRHYELRRLSVTELVVGYFENIKAPAGFSYPKVRSIGKPPTENPGRVAGNFLNEWAATPREVLAVMDALRLFVANWDYPTLQIELPYVLSLILNMIRGETKTGFPVSKNSPELYFETQVRDTYGQTRSTEPVKTADFEQIYLNGITTPLRQLMGGNYSNTYLYYVHELANAEYTRLYSGREAHNENKFLSWSEYRERVRELARFVDQDVEQVHPH